MWCTDIFHSETIKVVTMGVCCGNSPDAGRIGKRGEIVFAPFLIYFGKCNAFHLNVIRTCIVICKGNNCFFTCGVVADCEAQLLTFSGGNINHPFICFHGAKWLWTLARHFIDSTVAIRQFSRLSVPYARLPAARRVHRVAAVRTC